MPTSSLASALLAGLLQGLGERDGDKRMVEAGKRLAEQSCGKPPPKD
jgi:hypothetical protein